MNPALVSPDEIHDDVIREAMVLEAHVIAARGNQVVPPAWFAPALLPLTQAVSALTQAVSPLVASRVGEPIHILLNDTGIAPAAYLHTIQALEEMLEPEIDAVFTHYGIPCVGNVEHRQRSLAVFLGVTHLRLAGNV